MDKNLTIAIVDDEHALLEMLKQTLESFGHTCLTYTEAAEALVALKKAGAA